MSLTIRAVRATRTTLISLFEARAQKKKQRSRNFKNLNSNMVLLCKHLQPEAVIQETVSGSFDGKTILERR